MWWGLSYIHIFLMAWIQDTVTNRMGKFHVFLGLFSFLSAIGCFCQYNRSRCTYQVIVLKIFQVSAFGERLMCAAFLNFLAVLKIALVMWGSLYKWIYKISVLYRKNIGRYVVCTFIVGLTIKAKKMTPHWRTWKYDLVNGTMLLHYSVH